MYHVNFALNYCSQPRFAPYLINLVLRNSTTRKIFKKVTDCMRNLLVGFLLFLTFLLIHSEINAQVTIPNTAKQPAWVFPIYFEEGTGLKDTIYLGYDKDANSALGPIPGSIDTMFGEDYVVIDTSEFRAYWVSCCDALHDTVLRVNVSDASIPMGFSISFNNGVLPLTVKWDKSLFYSDSLPYPNQSPAPYAQGIMNFYDPMSALEADSNCCPSVDLLLISDTTSFGEKCQDLGCCRSDSAYFNFFCTALPGPLSGLGFTVEPWKGNLIGTAELTPGIHSKIRTYPNPASESIRVEHSVKVSSMQLYSTTGQQMSVHVEQGLHYSTINVLRLPAGIYFLQIKYNKFLSYHKVVINH